jgi:hypothetical protein
LENKHMGSTTNKSLRLSCFSPPVMVATLIIEFSLAAYTTWRYKMNSTARLAVLTLVALGTFQLSEYFVCTGFGLRAEQWSRVGFVMITALPPLGVHLMHKLSGEKGRKVVYASYATMAGFMAFFLTYKAAFIGHQCTGNYVIFQMGRDVGGAYGLYYYGWLFVSMGLGMRWANKARDEGKKKRLETIRGLIVGYLVFLVPTATSIMFKPDTTAGIPSIMCGFAVVFAIILTVYIMPRVGDIRQESVAHLKNA